MEIAIFIGVTLVGFGFFAFNVNKVIQNIKLGQKTNRSDNKKERLKTMFLVAFGQKKMFTRPIPALLHLTLYVAFLITQIELIEIIVDGSTGNHRFFSDYLGSFYVFTINFIEFLSIAAFVGTVIFLWRRNVLKLPRFTMEEMKGWPFLDANLILLMEIVLIACIFMMNGGDQAIHESSNTFILSGVLADNLLINMSVESLHLIEAIGWWGHYLMVLAFMNYLPYSKHFHIFLAFPNTYYSNLNPKGGFTNMESVTNEVKLMLDPTADPFATPAGENDIPKRFGAKDINDLTWKNLLDAYTCTECGRCTSSCPANVTGKKLSPRKIMMDTRDRMVELGDFKRKNGKDKEDGKSLLGDYISQEEIWACTSCNACVEECPVNIDPLSIIVDLRRYLVMEEAKVPSELTGMLTNIENNGAPWQFAQSDRLNWKDE